jgi:hypothetical protein
MGGMKTKNQARKGSEIKCPGCKKPGCIQAVDLLPSTSSVTGIDAAGRLEYDDGCRVEYNGTRPKFAEAPYRCEDCGQWLKFENGKFAKSDVERVEVVVEGGFCLAKYRGANIHEVAAGRGWEGNRWTFTDEVGSESAVRQGLKRNPGSRVAQVLRKLLP